MVSARRDAHGSLTGGTGSGAAVLLTGATGFLGMELLVRYLERTDRQVLALVRASDGEQARARIGGVLELLFGRGDAFAGRVTAIAGDLERERLGMTAYDRELVSETAEQIVHCAATVSFTSGLEESRRINVGGTRGLLELAVRSAERGVLQGVAHVSTAYVAGACAGAFGEGDLDVGQRFRNPYERSKFEAEQLVRSRASELPATTILRPSIIVGDSRTGWTPAFNVIYAPLRAFAKRQLRALPARRSAPVDVVPVDHVADAVLQLTHEHEPGLHTYHLVAGDQATTVGELVDLSARQLRRRPPPLVSPRLYRAARPLIAACGGRRLRRRSRHAAPFVPYYTMRVRYQRDRAAERLDGVGLKPPPITAYYDRLLSYATASDWGRRPVPRHALVAGQAERV